MVRRLSSSTNGETKYFTNEGGELVKYYFHQEKTKFISSKRRVMLCLLCVRILKTQVRVINF